MAVIFTPAASVWHANIQPYISLSDYKNAPTAIDTSQLIPGSNQAANDQELARVIKRASGWADRLCDQTLAATLDTQSESDLNVRRDGTVRVVCNFWPVLELDSFLAGPTPSTITAVTDTTNIALKGRNVLSVPVFGLVANTPLVGFLAGGLLPGDRACATWSYWNGWPHSTLTGGPYHINDASITVKTSLPAALAGQQLTISDGANEEVVTVSSAFTGGTTIPLVGGLANTHTVPAGPDSIVVTALPWDARNGVIHLTSCLIKTRGAEADVMDSIGDEPAQSAAIEGGGVEDFSIAVDLLEYFRRVV